MFSSLFTSLKSKTDPDNPFLPRQRLYQAYHLCEAHHISLGSQEGGFIPTSHAGDMLVVLQRHLGH